MVVLQVDQPLAYLKQIMQLDPHTFELCSLLILFVSLVLLFKGAQNYLTLLCLILSTNQSQRTYGAIST